MTFPVDLTCALTGATKGQLASWRRPPNPLLAPEGGRSPVLYSFRDVLALRTMVFLRSQVPLQRIRVAFESLGQMNLTDHPSRYKLTTDGSSIYLIDETGATDLVKKPGQRVLADLEQIMRPFPNFRDEMVVDFVHPRDNLELREGRMGGWPTILGTRIPYDTVARLQRGGPGVAVPPEEIERFYPSVSVAAAIDAMSFDEQVRAA
ncbi:DUF433 domain-containing protein [Rhodococcus hoagii]|nr:DUF433 domain-containing protein [Prescottella equi]NKR28523.1 DUF433 domain-containing protein [Prescottella equi]